MRVLLTMVLVSGLTASFSWTQAETDRAAVETQESRLIAPKAELTPQVFANGWVESRVPFVSVCAEQEGRLTSLAVDESEEVRMGQVLLEVDSESLVRKQKTLEAERAVAVAQETQIAIGEREETVVVKSRELEQAKVVADFAKRRLERANKLNRVLPEEERQLEEERYEVASAKIKVIEATLASLKAAPYDDELALAKREVEVIDRQLAAVALEIARCRVACKYDGEVVEVLRRPGEWVEKGEPVLRIAVAGPKRVRAFVEELDALQVAQGLSATVTTRSQPTEAMKANVTWVSPVMGPKRLVFDRPEERQDVKVREVLLELEQPMAWPSGMPVEVLIQLRGSELTDQESREDHSDDQRLATVASDDKWGSSLK